MNDKNIIRPDFIIVPKPVLDDQELTPMDRELFGYIYWLTKLKQQKCTASTRFLSELCGRTGIAGVRKGLSRLEKNGYIKRILSGINKKRTEIVVLISYKLDLAPNGARVAPNGAGGLAPKVSHISNSPIKEEKHKEESFEKNFKEIADFYEQTSLKVVGIEPHAYYGERDKEHIHSLLNTLSPPSIREIIKTSGEIQRRNLDQGKTDIPFTLKGSTSPAAIMRWRQINKKNKDLYT